MLIGDNIILRPLKIEDLEKTHEWRNNLKLIKHTQGIRFPKTIEMDQEWFQNVLIDTSNRNIYFGIDVLPTNEFIGIVQLNNIDYISKTATWGIVIGETSEHGKGFSVEASKLMLDYGFRILNLRKFNCYVLDYNKATHMMLKSIGGFEKEGRLRNHFFFDNEYHDVIILSLFKENFTPNENK